MDDRSGNIKHFTDDEIKKMSPKEKEHFIPLDELTSQEKKALEEMTFTERLNWVQKQKRAGRDLPKMSLTGAAKLSPDEEKERAYNETIDY